MPLSPFPVQDAFPGFQNIDQFYEILNSLPGARDTSHVFDTCPSIQVPGATIWVSDAHYTLDDRDDPYGCSPGHLLVEFQAPQNNSPLGTLRTSSLSLVQLALYTSLVFRLQADVRELSGPGRTMALAAKTCG